MIPYFNTLPLASGAAADISKNQIEKVVSNLLNRAINTQIKEKIEFSGDFLVEGKEILQSPMFSKLCEQILRKMKDGALTPRDNSAKLDTILKPYYEPQILEFGLKCLRAHTNTIKQSHGRSLSSGRSSRRIGGGAVVYQNSDDYNIMNQKTGVHSSEQTSKNLTAFLQPCVQATLLVFLLDEIGIRQLITQQHHHIQRMNNNENSMLNSSNQSIIVPSIFVTNNQTNVNKVNNIKDKDVKDKYSNPNNEYQQLFQQSLRTVRPSFILFPQRSALKKTSDILDYVVGQQLFSGGKQLSRQLFSQLRIQGRYEQSAEMEYRYEIKDCRTDLRDGIRLTKALEGLLLDKMDQYQLIISALQSFNMDWQIVVRN
ncbi:MAG: hypothetical protein EZS28_025310 [Streblomastix strix]|uniref:Calponin-homology (CH) domain-containing protein n=1 Tax=Streblomastix strix TaxID=222440 RepID=A0A5J4V9V2_9EUKA|nr:MAG: hypothetical protein EZS28_025310 [Streblomastix strix]